MSAFRAGEFNRDSLHGFFRPFCPARAINSIRDIDLEGLKLRGKKLILLDVDNTIVHWRQDDFEADIVEWINRAKTAGFHVAIVSNTRKHARLKMLSDRLGLVTMSGKFKPSRKMFLQALDMFKVEPKDAVMIGDQLFTDILGANRSGIEAIWVKQLSNKDFIGTKLSRLGERFMRSRLYRALVEAETPVETVEADNLPAPRRSSLVKQLIKFGVVGGISFAIDAGLTFVFMRVLSYDGTLVSVRLGTWLQSHYGWFASQFKSPSDAAFPILTGIAALLAMYNSFILNRAWTFDIRTPDNLGKQLRRFYVISIIGFFLNDGISSAIKSSLVGNEGRAILLAKMGAAVVVAFWNFFGSRQYAFKAETVK